MNIDRITNMSHEIRKKIYDMISIKNNSFLYKQYLYLIQKCDIDQDTNYTHRHNGEYLFLSERGMHKNNNVLCARKNFGRHS